MTDILAVLDRLEATEKERDTLRAKVARMERQVPICRAEDLKHAESLLPTLGLKPENPLYALPGAQPAPSEQDASVRKAWARFSHELHRSPDAPYPGMADAFEQHFSQSFIDREWRAEATTWAAAWKAAKSHCAQPAPRVPELIESLRCACNYIDKLGGDSQQYRAMIAAATEAK